MEKIKPDLTGTAETIRLRDQIYRESGRVVSIGKSALDPDWPSAVAERGKTLFVIEGLSMYLTADENAKLLQIIRDNFSNVS